MCIDRIILSINLFVYLPDFAILRIMVFATNHKKKKKNETHITDISVWDFPDCEVFLDSI